MLTYHKEKTRACLKASLDIVLLPNFPRSKVCSLIPVEQWDLVEGQLSKLNVLSVATTLESVRWLPWPHLSQVLRCCF